MKRPILKASLGLLACAIAGGAAAAQLKPEEQVEYRQSGYSFMAWNMGRIKANLDGEFNADKVAVAARTIAAIANSGMGELYGPGTANDVEDLDTRLKPEFFTSMDEVGNIARAFTAAANDLAKAAESGDKAAVGTAFAEVGKNCKACHDKFRAKDD